jgi:hypothetical protein
LKQLQKAVGNTLELIGIGNDFLNRTLSKTINKWDCIKPKSFFTAKETVSRLKRQIFSHRKGENLCQLI